MIIIDNGPLASLFASKHSITKTSIRCSLRKTTVLQFGDFSVYRYKKEHRNYPLELIGRDKLQSA